MTLKLELTLIQVAQDQKKFARPKCPYRQKSFEKHNISMKSIFFLNKSTNVELFFIISKQNNIYRYV